MTLNKFGVPRSTLAITSALVWGFAVAGCSAPAEEPEPVAVEAPSSLQQVDGRAVSASETELVLRTADTEYTFAIKSEDVEAVDPAHITSHIGVETLGFRVFYRNEGGVDYVVSVEEIKGSTLGFD